MDEAHCRCPGCGECSAHVNAPKLKAEIKSLKAQRQWIGLTPDEVREIYGKDLKYRDGDYARYAKAIEAKLKEKNT